MSSLHIGPYIQTFEAGKAVDGIYLPIGIHEFSSIVHTIAIDKSPWWRVNLERIHCIWAVRILNRASQSKILKKYFNHCLKK